MVVNKGSTPVSAKKKTVEELKKLNEKKKIMMEEDSEEEDTDTSEEEEEEDDSETGDEEVNDDEGSEEDDDDEDDDDEDEEEEETNIDALKKLKNQFQTPAKSKTPNKQTILSSPQKSEVQSNKKTPNKRKGLVQNESPMIISPKKSGKASDDSARTPSPSKQQKNKSVPFGTAEKRKREGDDEEGTLKKPRGDLPAGGNFLSEEQRKQRDRRCLFIRQVPLNTTEDEVKTLSSDIITVRFPLSKRKKRASSLFGFVEFASEEKAEENYSVLQKAKLKGQNLYVDYVGEKSKIFSTNRPTSSLRPENKRKLYLTGLPQNTTMEDIGKHFPHAMSINMKSAGSSRIANIDFETDSAAEEACKQNSSLKIKGQSITVMYALNSKSNRRVAKKKPLAPRGQQKSNFSTNQKKAGKKQDSEDDDSESDDDDYDEDDDDDSDEE